MWTHVNYVHRRMSTILSVSQRTFSRYGLSKARALIVLVRKGLEFKICALRTVRSCGLLTVFATRDASSVRPREMPSHAFESLFEVAVSLRCRVCVALPVPPPSARQTRGPDLGKASSNLRVTDHGRTWNCGLPYHCDALDHPVRSGIRKAVESARQGRELLLARR